MASLRQGMGDEAFMSETGVNERELNQVVTNHRYGLVVSAGGYSCAGDQPDNQDAFAVKIPMQRRERAQKGVVACVADGISGSAYAQTASQIAVTQFIDDYYAAPATWAVRPAVSKILHALNQWLYHQSQQCDFAHDASVTTFTGMVLISNTAHIMHVGDSRVYLFRQNQHDHDDPGSAPQETWRCLTHDHRRRQVGGQSVLIRGLGMDSHLEVDYQQIQVQAGDVLIFTTDGVHDVFTAKDDPIVHEGLRTVATVPSDVTALEALSRCIVQQAMAIGEGAGKKNDNATCLLVKVEALPELGLAEMAHALLQRVIPPVLKAGQRLDHFTVTEVLHSGTRSHVYQAISDHDGATYVLKVPSLHFAEDYLYLQGFIREGWVGEQLSHPAIMRIFAYSRTSRFLYHVCQKVEGITLRQWMRANPTPSLVQVQLLAEAILKAVRVLQRQGIVHRDLKPENIMVTAENQVVIIDLGTVLADSFSAHAVVLRETAPVGDKKYLAPECWIGQKATVQSDLFSVAVMLYEMLSGHFPYASSPTHAGRVMPKSPQDYRSLAHYRDDLPVWVDVVLAKACHPRIACRYASLSECMDDFSHPSADVIAQAAAHPARRPFSLTFWKLSTLALFVMVLIQSFRG